MKGEFRSPKVELLRISFTFVNNGFLLRVARGRWLREVGLVVNKGTRRKTRCTPYLFLWD